MAASMSESTVCRLCIDVCHKYKNLYDKNGRGNQLYEMTYKYFHPTILDMDQAKHLTAICLPCWRHIRDFHNFKLSILVAQAQLNEQAEQEVVVKLEREDASGAVDAGPSLDMTLNDTVMDSAMPFSLSQVKTEVDDIPQDPQIYSVFEITAVTGNANQTSTIEEDNNFIALPELDLIDVHDSIMKCDISQADADVQNPSSFATADGEETTIVVLVDVDSEDDPKVITVETGDDSEEIKKLQLIEAMPSVKPIKATSKGSGKKRGRPRKKQIAKKYVRPKKKIPIDIKAQKLDDLIAATLPSIKCRAPCNKPFSKFSRLSQHVLKKHPKRKVTILCCRRRLDNLERIEDHFRLHADPNAFRCETCLRDLRSSWALKRHFARTDHAKMLSPENACKSCDKRFMTNSALQQHYHSIHGGVIPTDDQLRYTCYTCGNVFNLTSYLRHRSCCHPVASAHICVTCGRSFKFLQNLRRHAVTHKRKVIYNCTFCSRMFTHYDVFSLHRQQAHDYVEEEDEEEIDRSVDENQAF